MMNIPNILKKYEDLPYIEKRVLQLRALSRDDIAKTSFLGVINDSDLKVMLGKQYNNYTLTPILDSLVNQSVLQLNKQGQYRCNPGILHHVLLDAVTGRYSRDNISSITRVARNHADLVDKLKLGIYLNNITFFEEATSSTTRSRKHQEIIVQLNHFLTQIDMSSEWLNRLLPEIQHWVVAAKIHHYLLGGTSVPGTLVQSTSTLGTALNEEQEIDVLKQVITNNLSNWLITSDFIIDLFLDFFLLDGDIEKIVHLIKITQTNPLRYHAILGVLDFLHADTNKALVNFDIAIKAIKDITNKRSVCLSGTYGICHILSLLRNDYTNNLVQIRSLFKNYQTLEGAYYKAVSAERSRYLYHNNSDKLEEIVKYFNINHRSSYYLLEVLIGFLESGLNKVDSELGAVLASVGSKIVDAFDCFILFLVLYWTKSKIINLEKYSADLYERCDKVLLGFASVVSEQNGPYSTENIDKLDADIETARVNTNLTKSYAPYNFDFKEIIHVKPAWERAINTLSSYFNKQVGGAVVHGVKTYNTRLVWMLSAQKNREMIVPLEQKRLDNAGWSKGRPASLKRLFENKHSLDYISEYDKSVINAIAQNYSYHGGGYYIDTNKALLALTNHPLVFDAETGEHVELTKTSPELIIKENNENYQINLSAYSDFPTVKLHKVGENKYQILDISQSSLDVIKIIGRAGIIVPKAAREQVLSLLQKAASNINVRTEFDTEIMDSKPGDPSIIIQLMCVDDILKIKALVRPFGGKGAYYKPNHGKTNIAAQIDNIYQGVTRNFAEEQKNITKLLDHCPILLEQDASDYEWKIDDLETSLEILYELNAYKTKYSETEYSITIEWPHGQSLFVDREISFDHLKLNIRGSNEWFSFDGEVKIEETQIIKMRDLLAKLDQSKGRFIELSDKRFIALTESFAKRLSELNVAAKTMTVTIDEAKTDNKIDQMEDKRHTQTIHKLAAPLLLEFAEKSKNVKTDNNWRAYIDKISQAEKYDPQVPTNLQAELRPYQIEGFKWLARLSNLGFGACLADDMGLGKTLQTIALLLEQAAIGPCLVVAPSSVCYVWEEECKKFAPSLNCISLGNSNNRATHNNNIQNDTHNSTHKNREEQINNLGKMDVLICSYGMLYQIEELLVTKQFQVIVLDEAQAIKNFNTKRFKIITQLKTANKIALSGTPVENRTEELWNLFEFLNPGFLGSRQSFQTKYTKPIEVDKNIASRNTLKRLIQPFILRRIKSKVLDELPPKTEQTIFVEPTEQEKNFYEALRRESVEKINNLINESASSAKQRFSILAEITKLRRACCDSSLVDETLEMPNSKLETFDEIVTELKENNHRALVFSQYVGYLDIVKKRLDAQKISYQYLDGSSTQKQRQKSVEAFQSGEGDLFLISLKAGGVGLNLTAADYVVHLDPWWNPAIEDQASDRAHRIGQTRPVTIYRLVMKYSIEEKILKMHHDKRELAISLLSDTDKSASLNESDLLALITQTLY